MAINKIEKEAGKTLIVAPMWPAQTWFIWALELATETPIINRDSTTTSARQQQTTPASLRLKLMAIGCYKNKHQQQIDFRKQLTFSSLQPGYHRLRASTNRY